MGNKRRFSKKDLEGKFDHEDTLELFLPRRTITIEVYEKNGINYYFKENNNSGKYYLICCGRVKR